MLSELLKGRPYFVITHHDEPKGDIVSLDLAMKYVAELLTVGTGRSRYRVMDRPNERVEILPGLLYRFTLFGGPENQMRTLSLYLGVGGLGGALWQQETRTLERLSGFAHPALPELIDGGHLAGLDGDVGAAYVLTVRRGTSATDEWFSQLARSERGKVLLHLWLLADALGVLHGASISHRGLWPGALFVQQDAKEDGTVDIISIQLARFEMSALLANLFRNRAGSATYSQLRETYLADGARSLLYTPPERLRFLFDEPNAELGGPPGDVFSLGMIAAEWFVTGVPPVALPSNYHDLLAFQKETRRSVRNASGDVPVQICELINDMLDPTPTGRPTAFEVAQRLSACYADAQVILATNVPQQPYLVVYMPTESDRFIERQWHLITDSAMTAEGQEQLAELIERDMRGAEILHSPSGAHGFASDTEAKVRRAKTVIIGTSVTWFCELFWAHKPGGGTRVFEEMLLIKYVRQTSDIEVKLGRLRVSALVRKVPMVEAQPVPTEFELAAFLVEGRPVWSTLVNPVETGRAQSEKEREYLDSLEWYLNYQLAMLEARTYAYAIDEVGDGDRLHLRWDPVADRIRQTGDRVLSQVAIQDTRRLDMAVFVSSTDNEFDRGRVQLASEATPDWDNAYSYDVIDVIEPNIVVISTRGSVRPPDRGWLRSSTDAGTMPQITRQREALRDLGLNRVLLRRLIQPKAEIRAWDQHTGVGGELRGEGRAAVREILAHQGLFALQGPPGTGKTEVTSEAVVEYLTRESGARVLISAQSHDALENLAVRITRKLGITVPDGSDRSPTLDRLALRIRTSGTSYESTRELADLQPAQLAGEVIRYSVRRSRQWLASRRSEFPALVPVIQTWLKRADDVQLELTRRVCTAANIVFATTGAATGRNLFVDATNEPFDWVVVEEAARAWPTELALPLVRGVRWTLVGDHVQIGAYSRNDVEAFLQRLGDFESEDLQSMYEARERHSQNFGTFAKLFESGAAGPTLVLTQQYRMDAQISEVVGDVFYSESGGLQAMRSPAPHPLEAPEELLGTRLVWIDTGLAERSVGFWSNEYEAAICARIVRDMVPRPGVPGGPSIAVITPYRAQVQQLQNRLSEHYNHIHTVDGFQGREADIVVVSLVRDRRKEGASPIATVGHVSEPARINVMLSRARDLLVLVGRFDIYATSAGPKWQEITERIKRTDNVRSPKDR